MFKFGLRIHAQSIGSPSQAFLIQQSGRKSLHLRTIILINISISASHSTEGRKSLHSRTIILINISISYNSKFSWFLCARNINLPFWRVFPDLWLPKRLMPMSYQHTTCQNPQGYFQPIAKKKHWETNIQFNSHRAEHGQWLVIINKGLEYKSKNFWYLYKI